MGQNDLMVTARVGDQDLGHFNVTAPYHTSRKSVSDRWLLFCTREGRGRIGHADGDIFAHAGSIALIAPGALHDYGVEPEFDSWHFLWAHLVAPPTWQPWLRWPEIHPGLAYLEPAPGSFAAIDKALLEALGHAGNHGIISEALCTNALERTVLHVCAALPNDRGDPRVAKAVEICRTEFADDLSLPVLARRCGTSVSRLTACFRTELGCSIRSFIERLRLQQACALLVHSDLPISEIASRSGFSDPFYFSQRFHLAHGQAPSVWRQQRHHDKSAP